MPNPVNKYIVFTMNEMYTEPQFLCDCIISGNGYCKCVMTSTAESKRVFFFKSPSAH